MNPKPLQFGMATHKGTSHAHNEDAVYGMASFIAGEGKITSVGYFVVLDGKGEEDDSLKAVDIALKTISQNVHDFLFSRDITFQQLKPDRVQAAIKEAYTRANITIVQRAEYGSTSVTGGVIVDDVFYIGHIGDTRAYVVQNDSIQKITQDHDLHSRLIELGQITREEIENGSFTGRNAIYKVLGQSYEVTPDMLEQPLEAGYTVLLCTDGLTKALKEDAIQQIIREHIDIQQACDTLVAQASQADGEDDITVILVRVPA